MTSSIPFFATCPVCGQRQVQRAYTRRALVNLLENGRIIDAYCMTCDVVWPVSAQERSQVTSAMAARRRGASPSPIGSDLPLQPPA
jgi:hypothetical protein